MKFDFIKNGKKFYIFTLVVIVAAIACFVFRGFNMDIEFVGGTELSFALDKGAKPDGDEIKKYLKDNTDIGDDLSSVRIANGNEFVVRTTLIDEETNYDEVNADIVSTVKSVYPGAEVTGQSEGKVTFKITDPDAVAEPEIAEPDAAETQPDETADEITDETTNEITDETADEDVNSETNGDNNADGDVDEVEEKEEEKEPFSPISSVNSELAKNKAGFISISMTKAEAEDTYDVTYVSDTELNRTREQIKNAIDKKFPTQDGSTRLTGTSTVSAEVSDSLKSSAIIATLVAVVLMLVYIAIRFEGRAAFAAVACLAHDIILVLFAYSAFQIPVSSTIIAVILTILGYSINATIVIFDRVRENNKAMGDRVSFGEKADAGVKSTLWRSLNTTITTLITIGLVYILGVTSIKNFALPLIVGIVSGVYSSVCLSANLWVSFKKLGNKK